MLKLPTNRGQIGCPLPLSLLASARTGPFLGLSLLVFGIPILLLRNSFLSCWLRSTCPPSFFRIYPARRGFELTSAATKLWIFVSVMAGFLEQIEPLKRAALAELRAAADLAALEQARGDYLGSHGKFTAL